MTKKLHNIFLLFSVLFAVTAISVSANGKVSPDGIWKEIDDSELKRRPVERLVEPDIYKTFRLDKTILNGFLKNAPLEFSAQSRNRQTILTLPLPDGTFSRFDIKESPLMEEGLAVRFPDFKTYIAQGIDNPSATARISFTPTGLRAMIFSGKGAILIDPYAVGDSENYVSYSKSNIRTENLFVCEFENQMNLFGENYNDLLDFGGTGESVISGSTLRTYRLALAATAEYTNVFRQTGDTDAQAKARALEQQVIIMTRVNGVYERDLAIRMVLVANNDTIIYTDPATDPYTNSSGSMMLTENTVNLTAAIGLTNFDIGHVFSTGGGGVATLNGPCGNNKARGVTGLPNPVGDAFSIDYVAHEMGHQWGANHTFNGAVSSCSGGNRSANSAYEPGSGITIMAYAGICGNQDLARNSIDTFHVKSLEVIVAYSQTGNGNTCAVSTSTGNTPPTITSVGGTSFNIPKGTPFALTANGSDAENDALTYDWQQYNLAGSTTAVPNTDADGTARPIFRPYLPTESPTRYFPALEYILNNANVPPSTYDCGRATPCLTGELLPAITRTMNFQGIVRDNRLSGGGINTVSVQVAVDGNSGPFAVTAPNTNATISSGNYDVTWNVANSNIAPVNAAVVRISLSTDGGNTFPTILRGAATNDGSQTVFIPPVNSTTARIKIEAVGNIFFDISDVNFAITTQPVFVTNPKFDFDGDGKSDVSVYRGGTWYVQNSTQGFFGVQFGISTDKTVAADYDGDGKTDVAVFRDGTWYIIRSSDNAVSIIGWGSAGDIPVPGNYDGDNKADLAIYRAGVWYVLNSSNGNARIEQFGLANDKPVTGDFDGDNKQDLAVFRDGTWYIQGSLQGFIAFQFGSAGDIPQPEDFDGDYKTDAAVYRNGIWYVLGSTAGFSAVQWGNSTDIPATADYDGDGKADFVVFRPGEGNWYLLRSQSGVSVFNFGLSGDQPIPAQSN